MTKTEEVEFYFDTVTPDPEADFESFEESEACIWGLRYHDATCYSQGSAANLNDAIERAVEVAADDNLKITNLHLWQETL